MVRKEVRIMTEYHIRLYRSKIDINAVSRGDFRYNRTHISDLRMKASTLTQFRRDLKRFLASCPEEGMYAEVMDSDDGIIATVEASRTTGPKGIFAVWNGKKKGMIDDSGELIDLNKELNPTYQKYGFGFKSDLKGEPSYSGASLKAESVDALRRKIVKNTPKLNRDYYNDRANRLRFDIYRGNSLMAVMDVYRDGTAYWFTPSKTGKNGVKKTPVDPATGKLRRA